MTSQGYLMSSEIGPAEIEKISEKSMMSDMPTNSLNFRSITGGNINEYNFMSKDANFQKFLNFDLNELAGGFFSESIRGGDDVGGLDSPDLENDDYEYSGGHVQDDEDSNNEYNKINNKIKELYKQTDQELYGGAPKKNQSEVLGFIQKTVRKLKEMTDNKFTHQEYVSMAWKIVKEAQNKFGDDKVKRNDVKLIEPIVNTIFSDGSYKKFIKK